MKLRGIYEKFYETLPEFYTFNFWKANVTYGGGYDVTVNLRYDYRIKYGVDNKNKYELFKAYFINTRAKELTFFEFLDRFSTLHGREVRNRKVIKNEAGETILIYVSVPDLYLNELMRFKGNFTAIYGKKVRAFIFVQALNDIRVYSMNNGEISTPSIPFYIFSKPVRPPELLYVLSAIHFYNYYLTRGEVEAKKRLLYPLIYWRMFEVNKNSILGSDTASRIANIIIKENPKGLEEIVKELFNPENEYLKLMISKAYDEETKEMLDKLIEKLEKEMLKRNGD